MTVFVNVLAIGITACILVLVFGVCILITVETIRQYRRKK